MLSAVLRAEKLVLGYDCEPELGVLKAHRQAFADDSDLTGDDFALKLRYHRGFDIELGKHLIEPFGMLAGIHKHGITLLLP